MQGPIFFVNHEGEPNCRYEVQKGKNGVVFLQTVVNTEKGSEITFKYSKFFKTNGSFACVLTASITHQRR